ncbi:MAG: TIGR03435 family protein [Vicinamibacterales bacterium]
MTRERAEGDVLESVGDQLGRRVPSAAEERVVLDRVWSDVRKQPDHERVLGELRAAAADDVVPTARWRFVQMAAAAVLVVAAAVGTAIVWPPADTALFRVVEGEVHTGDTITSNGGGGAVLALPDGSRIEMRSQTDLSVERADDGVRIRLASGGIIVNAAKQRTGHLYVQTKDMTVSVVGTVFLVNADDEGSRVAVIEGEVRVEQGGTEQTLRQGDYVTTSPAIAVPPVREAIAWSRNAGALTALLQQSAVVPPAITAQSPAAPPRETFEVASVRLRAPAAPGGRGGPGPDGQEPKCYGSVQLDPRRLALTNMMLYRVIALAYGKSCYESERMDLLSGGPRWVTADRYDIEATLPPGTPTYTREQFDPATWGREPTDVSRLQAMLQAMLADRFKLIVKRETREMPGFVLSVARGGPRLTAWKDGERATLGAVTGGANANGEWRSIVRGEKLSMARLATQLTLVTQRPVVDRTGIAGDFNYNIEFTPFSPPPDLVTRGAPLVAGPSLFTALEEAMGLRLEAARIPMEFLVIERVERPSEN